MFTACQIPQCLGIHYLYVAFIQVSSHSWGDQQGLGSLRFKDHQNAMKGCLLEKQHVLWLRKSSQSTHVCSLLSSSTAVRADIKVLLIWHTFFMWCAGFLETKAKAFLWRHHCFCSVGGHGSSLHLRQVWMWCFRSGLQVQKNMDLWVL